MSDLPNGWAQTTMGRVANIKLGKMLDAAKNKGDPVQYLRNVNVRWDSFDLSDLLEMRMTADELEIYSIKDGDVLICEGGEPGRAAVWRSGPTNLKFQKALHRTRTYEGVLPEFLAHYLKHVSVTGEIESKFTGTTIKHLPLVAILELPLPLAPTPEQQRIVATIDSLSAKTRRARSQLDHVSRLVEKYKQAILAAALRGELTREWRVSAGCTDAWEDTTIGAVLTDIRYGTAKKCGYDAGRISVLRIPNVQRGHIVLDDIKSADFSVGELGTLRLEEGDILVIRSNGSLDLVGRSAVVGKEAVGMIFAGYLIRLRLDRRLADPRFIQLHLRAGEIRVRVERLAKSTSGVNNINSSQIKGLPLLLPCVDEQQEIVRRIKTSFTWIDRLATEATSARELIDHLNRAVLAKAFRGELVPQEPNDEPASVLLERIRAERATGLSKKALTVKRGRLGAA